MSKTKLFIVQLHQLDSVYRDTPDEIVDICRTREEALESIRASLQSEINDYSEGKVHVLMEDLPSYSRTLTDERQEEREAWSNDFDPDGYFYSITESLLN